MNATHALRAVRRTLLPTLSLAALCAAVATAQAADIDVSDARLSILPGDTPGAGYFTLHNASDETISLVGAESPAFEAVEVHESMEHDGMMHMHELEAVEVEPGASIEFAPKGHHLMLMRRTQEVNVGDEVDVTLRFAEDTTLPVTFDVVSPAEL